MTESGKIFSFLWHNIFMAEWLELQEWRPSFSHVKNTGGDSVLRGVQWICSPECFSHSFTDFSLSLGKKRLMTRRCRIWTWNETSPPAERTLKKEILSYSLEKYNILKLEMRIRESHFLRNWLKFERFSIIFSRNNKKSKLTLSWNTIY